MIRIGVGISIGEEEIQEDFFRASGPGGQNVNKVSTAVRLRFDVAGSPSLSEAVRRRLLRLAGPRRVTGEGVLLIEASRHRTRQRNRDDAMERLVELIQLAAVAPKKRRKTRPTRASKERRLEGKRRQSLAKGLRRTGGEE